MTSALLISPMGRPAGGVPTPFGDLLLGPITQLLLGTPWFGGSAFVGANLPLNLAFVGLDFFVQGAFLDLGGMFPGPDVQLASGYRLVLGAP